MTMPCSWDVVVPSELCSDWDARPQTIKDSALWLASTYLWGATGRQFGTCPVTVRPIQPRFWDVAYRAYPVWPGSDPAVAPFPYLWNGAWFNTGCGAACCSSRSCDVTLQGPVPVTEITEVLVDGEVIPSTAYRVDMAGGAARLVRLDGQCWPTCQNIEAGEEEDGSFVVTYLMGREVPEALAIATAVLACQYGKLLGGGDCALPVQMTRLTRQGVELEVVPQDTSLQVNKTGIKIVDDIVDILNPSKRRSPPQVLSPDLEACDRYTTIYPGGS